MSTLFREMSTNQVRTVRGFFHVCDQGGAEEQPQYLDQLEGGLWDKAQFGHESSKIEQDYVGS